jgi:hypothetical protein
MSIVKRLFKNISNALKEGVVTKCSGCGQMKVKGKELMFVSHIKRDGSGTTDVSNENMSHLNETEFYLKRLSITNRTYIALEFNAYVVRLK